MRISDWSSDVCSSDLNPQNCERHIRDMRILLIPLRVTFLFDGPGTAFVVPGGQPKKAEAGDADRQTADSDRTEQDIAQPAKHCDRHQRSEERRVGQECVSTCRSRWAQEPSKKKKKKQKK